jgi:hypothetical protein
MAKKDPFPNDWEEVSNTDPEDFITGPYTEVLDELMNWYLPDPFCAVVRVFNREHNKVHEYAYRLPSKAQARIREAASNDEEVTILTQALIATINYEV